jgi:hypothetical protein
MNERDPELEKLFNSLRAEQPTDLQMQKWKNVIPKSTAKPQRNIRRWFELTAAIAVGFVFGLAAYHNFYKPLDFISNIAQMQNQDEKIINDESSATIETISVKTQ